MSEVKVSDFNEYFKHVSGQQRKRLHGGITYRISNGVSKSEIIEYIKAEVGSVSESSEALAYTHKIHPTAPALAAAEAVREPRDQEIPRDKIEAVIREMEALQTSEISSHSGVRLEVQPRSFPPIPVTKTVEKADFLARASELKSRYLYLVCRIAIYIAVIMTSYKPVEAFFDSLGIFSGIIAAPMAAIIAIAVDLIAMDLFARGILILRPALWKNGLAFVCTSLAIVIGNIYVVREHIADSSNVRLSAKAEKAWEKDLTEAKAELKKKEDDYALNRGKFLAEKWRGASNPDACETGKVRCKGPFTTAAQIYQAPFLAADTALASAKDAVNKLKKERPVISDGSTSSGVTRKIYVYAVLWIVILLTYIYEPRRGEVIP